MELKIAFSIILISVSNILATPTYSQLAKISLDMESRSLEQVMDEIERQSEFYFIFNQKQIDVNRIVNIREENKLITDILPELFKGTNINYVILDRKILLTTDALNNISKDIASVLKLQQGNISGTVTDASTGQIMPGVYVLVKGTTIGAISDINGKYSIPSAVDQNATLTFSFIGYITQEVSVAGKTVINIALSPVVTGLDEVVVVGYGQQKKVNLTGSVDALDGNQLTKRSLTNVSQALQGVSPGTIVINRGGAPGIDEGTILIRGIGTFGNNNPLILVDGVPVSDMRDVYARDIENISVLKDAASSSIYGSRAANGVILITTKRGTYNDFKVSYSSNFGQQSLTRKPEHISIDKYMILVNEACANANRQPKYSEEYMRKTMEGTEPYKYPNTKWFDLLYSAALQQKHSIAITGGTEKSRTAISFNYIDKEGILLNTSSNQYLLRANNDLKLGNKLNFRSDLSFSKRFRTQPSRVNQLYENLIHDLPPTIVAKYPDGTYGLGYANGNPLACAEQSGYEKYDNYQFIITNFVTYEIASGLKLTGNFSIKEDLENGKNYSKFYEFRDFETKVPLLTWTNDLNEGSSFNHYYNLQGLLDYDRNFNNHNLHLLLGYSREHNSWRYVNAYRRDFYSNDLQELDAGSSTGQANNGNSTEWALLSYFGRINYSFANKYLFEGNVRRDGSSRFAKGNRWGFFPSLSFGWRVSEENFLKNNAWLNNLKLRLSWGQLGNQDIGLYEYIQTISLGQNYSFANILFDGAARTKLANQDISWEKTTSSNIGIDIGLWNNKLTASADYFVKNTDDILLERDIPLTVGLDAPTQNVGAVKNTGWELSIDFQEEIRDVMVRIGFNISNVKNKIIRYGEQTLAGSYGWEITKEGESMESLFGYVNEGLFQTTEEVDGHAFQNTITGPGDIKLRDINKDDIINDLDRVILGNQIPHYSYGLNLQVEYKNFNATLLFNGVGKYLGYRLGAYIEGPIWDCFTTNEMWDRWTPENTDASWPRLVYNTVHNQLPSDYWLQNKAFFRFKSFRFGYSLPESLLSKMRIGHIEAYVDGENIFTLTKATNVDPEAPSGRSIYYPQTKIFTIGVDVTF